MADSSRIDPELVHTHKFPEVPFFLDPFMLIFMRDAALYALGVGACARDAVDDDELKYVYHENWTKICAGRANVCCCIFTCITTKWFSYARVRILNKVSLAGLHDKGKAAVLEIETKSYQKESGELLCMNRTTFFLRGAGGFSKSSQPYSYSNYPTNKVSAVKIPKTQPFAAFEDCTQPSQALLYRLSGDYNPLHSDPMVAKIAGFSRPILPGLCTLGFAVRAIIKCICRGDPNLVKSISGRFLLHVYPGETLITEMWLEGLRVIYQAKVKERNQTVLSGYVDIHRLTSSV
uniref:Uncharacterized protein n=1 Tax=Fagus sylvatica TaxID=28930 RepID=A0A2N9FL79_FAGSY